MDNELRIIFKSVLGVRDTLEETVSEIKTLIGQGHEAHAEPIEFLMFAARRAALSSAPLLQDLWVLFELGEKRNGYFVEFGAAGGPAVSTTLLLETLYGWRGAIAEPARSRYDKLRSGRSCYATNKFVYTDDGLKMLFNDPDNSEEPSAAGSPGADVPTATRRGARRYEVETVTLRSFLQAADAPATIDYMSINAEADTLDVLSRFDWAERAVTMVSVASDDAQQRDEIGALMARHGYERRFKTFAVSEDWYIKGDRAEASRQAAA